jgi:hypothetical protein
MLWPSAPQIVLDVVRALDAPDTKRAASPAAGGAIIAWTGTNAADATSLRRYDSLAHHGFVLVHEFTITRVHGRTNGL